MARTSRHVAALTAAITLAFSSGSSPSQSQELEPGIELDGKKLFDKETFGGSGQTCLTCHSKRNCTLTLGDMQRIVDKRDPDNLLVHDALDEDDIVAYLKLLGPRTDN